MDKKITVTVALVVAIVLPFLIRSEYYMHI